MYNPNLKCLRTTLVGLCGLLAGLELLEVPAADLHVAVVLGHAVGEVLCVDLAASATVLLALSGDLLGLLLLNWLRGASAEEAANGVADGGADGNTAVQRVNRYAMSPAWSATYAAVLAIWPKRPGPPDC